MEDESFDLFVGLKLRRSYLIPGGNLGQFSKALLEECAERVVVSVGCRGGAFVHLGLNM